MTIDLKRLAVDADYWDEVAPEGASHLIDDVTFTKWEYGQEFSWNIRQNTAWVADDSSYSLSRYLKEGDRWKVLAKPIKPASPKSHPTDTQPTESGAQISAEWDGNIPPVGWHGECTWGRKCEWSECVILPVGKIAKHEFNGWFVRVIDDYRAIDFRPIRSQADRDREEIINAADAVMARAMEEGQPMAEALYAAGLLSNFEKP
jgi:hypothetical protein